MMTIWDDRYKTGEGLRWWPNEELVRFLGRYWPKKMITGHAGNALDLGAGTGCNTWLLYDRGFDVDVCESSPSALDALWAYSKERGFSYKCLGPAQLPSLEHYRDRVFDLVVDCQTIQHLSTDDHLKVYSEVMRVLKSGGHFWSMHWREGDAARLYAGCYPELRTWRADELGTMIQGTGLHHGRTILVSRCEWSQDYTATVEAHWYCQDWVKP